MNETNFTPIVSTRGAQQQSTEDKTARANQYHVPFGYLRAFLVVLVVAHHAVLAYHTYAPPPSSSLVAQPRLWEAFPVVDTHRSTAFALFVGFNDTFFMSLMFFLSGLFVWNSLQRKGAGVFIRDRLRRLGLPFLVAVVLLAPIAYYPAYLQASTNPSLSDFWRQWRSLGNWPAGPAWFLWVLLTFDCVAAGLFAVSPRWAEVIHTRLSGAFRSPLALFGLIVAGSAAVYLPMALKFTSLYWTAIGPFTFQTSRIFHYAFYFLAGILVGVHPENTSLNRGSVLARRWPVWAFSSLFAFAVVVVSVILAFSNPTKLQTWELIGGCAFVVSCAASSFAFLSLFLRFAAARKKVMDSLSLNSYGIYVFHYIFVNWAQLALLKAALPALAKGGLVFLCALMLSWGTSIMLRRVRAMAAIL
jgi:peptidoglycan/LPS O-acetylase OafA/YrhL